MGLRVVQVPETKSWARGSASLAAFLHSRIVILVLSVVSILDALDAELKENRIYVIQVCCSQFTINCQ